MEASVIAEPSITAGGTVPGERRWSGAGIRSRRWLNLSAKKSALGLEMEMEEGSGGKMMVELVGAFNKLTKRMSGTSSGATTTTGGGESVVFDALKLSIPLLRRLPDSPAGRPALSRSLAVALTLADLRMDAEVISAALLLHPLQAGAASLHGVRARLGPGTAHLLNDALRLSNTLLLHDSDSEDEDSAAALRRYCLTLYDSRAVALELASASDAMAHELPHLPRYDRQRLSLRALRLHAPLAHALALPLPLEDLAFPHLFPFSYLYLDAWLRSLAPPHLLESCRLRLLRALRSDPALSSLAAHVSVTSRHKSRFSTMRKILSDGRRPNEVHDVLGLRVVLRHLPLPGDREGTAACYRTREVARSIWGEIDGRVKDYLANPKPNGYRSLHMAVEVPPVMEIQIRTAEMDSAASGGAASHSFYKAGLADPDEAVRLKAIMVAAAELAALRLREIPGSGGEDGTKRAFRLLDKNGDGRISVEELREVMEELGAPGEEDARRMMTLLDVNSDGSLSSDEFESFQRQVDFMRSMDDTDDRYKTMLNEKLQFDLP